MGYHNDVYQGLETLVSSGVSVPVLNGLTADEAQVQRLAAYVVIVRDSITFDRAEVIGGGDQYERWTWKLYVVGGGGSSTTAAAGGYVDSILEALRTALTAQKPEARCGPLHLVSETYEGRHGPGVLYVQTWTHDRWTG